MPEYVMKKTGLADQDPIAAACVNAAGLVGTVGGGVLSRAEEVFLKGMSPVWRLFPHVLSPKHYCSCRVRLERPITFAIRISIGLVY